MDNPAYFTVLRRTDDAWDFTDAGLFGSIRAAADSAGKILANSDVPVLNLAVAVISMLDQDPVTGTPLGHLAPRNAAGYALASISVADYERRGLSGTIYLDFPSARSIAEVARSRNRASGNDTVLDIVALTVIELAATTARATYPELEN